MNACTILSKVFNSRMASVSVSFFVHYVSFMLSLAVITCDYTYIDLPTHHIYAGRFKYLTFWSFLCGLVYNNMAAIFDFLVWSRGRESVLWRNIRDYLFTTVVFPLAVFVCSMFWLLLTIDPRFMRSEEEEKIIPLWMSHGYHTLPILTVFLQAYIIQHSYPRKRMALLSITVADSVYIIWLFWVAYHANYWVYPFLEKMSLVGVLLFLVASVFLSFGLYFVGKKFNDFVWGNEKLKSP